MPDICLQGVGNKANRRIPKNTPNFPKTNICYPLHQGFFRKIWRALFTCYLRFEIRPLALLPTKVLENVPAKCRVK